MAGSNGNGVRANGSGTHAGTEDGPARAVAVEDSIAALPGVRGARVVLHQGRVIEVHVIAGTGRSPKQIVRDVESLLKVEFELEIDHRTVSVVQMDDQIDAVQAPATEPEAEAAPSSPRPGVVRVAAQTEGLRSKVTVELSVGGEVRTGVTRGSAQSSWRVGAQATLEALGDLLDGTSVEIESSGIVSVGDRHVALVVLRVARGREDLVLTGSASARRDPHDAIARATLDALNRVLAPTA